MQPVSSRHTGYSRGKSPGNSKSPEFFCWCKFLNVVPAFRADIAVFLRAFVKNVAARYDFRAQNTPKCVCFALDSTGEITELPQTL